MIIQIFIREVIKVKLMFNQISITFDIKDLSPMALFQLKDMMVISITGIRASIKLIGEEYIWSLRPISIIQEDNWID